MTTSTDWMVYGACTRPQVADLSWTDEDTTAADRARMARVCAACPMLAVCRVYTATHEVTAGFWAGRDRNEPDLPDTRPASASSRPGPVTAGGVQDMLPGLADLLAVA